MLRLLVKAGADVNVLSQRRRTVASSVSIILGIANVLKYLIELGARTPFIIKVLARMHRLRENWIN